MPTTHSHVWSICAEVIHLLGPTCQRNVQIFVPTCPQNIRIVTLARFHSTSN